MQIYLARNNQQAGPYSVEQLNQMLASQQVLLTDLAWHQGMSEWKALGELTQGQMYYQPAGYVAPIPTADNAPFGSTYQNPTITHTEVKHNAKVELASIPARALAKIIDLLLWIPATFILTAFFSSDEQVRFASLNEKIMSLAMSGSQDTQMLLNLQGDLIGMIPTVAWATALAYLIAMLAVQGFLINKSGQSIGKKLTKIKIVDIESNDKVSLMRAFTLRSMVLIVPTLYFIPLFSIVDWAFALGKKRQTLHDKLAKTKVIKQ